MPNHTILLIDYEPKSIEQISRPLEDAGYTVQIAKDGFAGVEAFEGLKPDLVLVEAMLPKKHGFDVCREIKAKPGGQDTPVLITTSVYRGRKYRNEAVTLYGCDEYIEKPVPGDELVLICEKFLVNDDGTNGAEENAEGSAVETGVPDEFNLEHLSEGEIIERLDALLDNLTDERDDKETEEPEAPVAFEQEAEPAVAPEPPPSEGEVATDSGQDLLSVEPASAEEIEVGPEPGETVEQAEQTAVAIDPVEEIPEEVPGVAPEDETEPDLATRFSEPISPSRPGMPLYAGIGVAVVILVSVMAYFGLRKGESATPQQDETTEPVYAETTVEIPPPRMIPTGDALVSQLETARNAAADVEGGAAGKMNATDQPVRQVDQPVTEIPEKDTAAARVDKTPERPVPEPAKVKADESAAATVTVKPEQVGAKVAESAVEPAPPAEAETVDSETSADDTMPGGTPESFAGARQKVAPEENITEPRIEPPVARDDAGVVATPEEPEVVNLVETPEAEVPASSAARPAVEKPAPRIVPAKAGDLVDINEVDVKPVSIKKKNPTYQPSAMRQGQHGTVVMSLLINEKGQVDEVKVLRAIEGSTLTDSAVRAAGKWKYEPAMKDGVPVKVWKTEVVQFKLPRTLR